MENGKRTIAIYSNAAWLRTGFGKNAKNILSYLWKTNKYNLINVCGGVHGPSEPRVNHTPWKSIGAIPNNLQELKDAERDPHLHRLMVYGNSTINQIVNDNKVDIVFVIEDPWSITLDHPFVGKIPVILWTTPDSLPILPQIVDQAAKLKDYWVWSSFATKELHKLGHTHVKTVHGPVDSTNFYKLSDKERAALRNKNNISQDAFIISFVFRNQYRKSVDKLIEGYKIFKNQNPEVKNTFLYLHTNFSEGWNVQVLANEFQVPMNEILCTYVCKSCKEYEVKSFSGQDKDCPFCSTKGIAPNQQNPNGSGQITANVIQGVTETQLNEIYNLSNLYCHPFNSGGQELPIQEAKLCELVTLVTNYSCGEEMCEDGAGSLALDYSFYKDLNQNQFNKAITYPSSIAKQISKAYFMKPEKLAEMGRKGREWVLKNYSIDIIGKMIEDFIDAQPETTYDYKSIYRPKNANAQIPDIQDNEIWIKTLYKEILNMEDGEEGVQHWLKSLKDGAARQQVSDYFRNVANQENQKNQKVDFKDILGPEAADERILFCIPKSIGDCFLCTALFKSINELYPDKKLYVACEPQYFEVFEGNQHVFRTIQWQPFMDNILPLEGVANIPALFSIVYVPHFSTQRLISYTHAGRDKSNLELRY